jgi:hypothetical protein
MTISGSWLHHPMKYQVQEKKARGGFRTVAPSTGAADSGSLSGHAVERNLNKEPSLGFGGGIGAAKGSVISDSAQATYKSQQVPALLQGDFFILCTGLGH